MTQTYRAILRRGTLLFFITISLIVRGESLDSSQQWWHGFEDPVLLSLINITIENNYDVAMALKRVEVSRLARQQAMSGYYPTISGNIGWDKARSSGYTTVAKLREKTTDYFSLGLSSSWEIDLFGKIRRKVEEQGATWQATKAEYDGTIISVTAELANSYINLRTYQEELEVARHLLESETNVMDIAEARHECALASGLDVAQAKAVYYSTKASIPSLKASIDTSINSIALLSGVDKDELEEMLGGVPRIPQYSGLIITEIPESLLMRRPDVVAAAYQVDSYAAAVGVAKSAYLPSLTLDASIGTASHRIKNIFSHDALTYSIAPTLSWTLFTGFSRKYATAQAEEQLRIGRDNYDLTLLTAEEEANNALAKYHYSLTRIGLLNSVLAESSKAFNFALDQYKQGLSAFINVVDAQINLLNYNNQLIEERSNAQLALVALYQALGGGWVY